MAYAPLSNEQLLRYSRHLLMDGVGLDGQSQLMNSHVLIAGLGGLGSPVSSYLAAAGVGRLSLCDHDTVELSNLQRQVIYTTANIGQLKVDSAKETLMPLNPNIIIDCYPQSVTKGILNQGADVVVDCTDNLDSKLLMNKFCYQNGIDYISASAMGWEGQVIGFDFKKNRTICYGCISNFDSKDQVLTCTNFGVLGPILGVIGSLQALTAIKMLLGKFNSHGEMQCYDGLNNRWLNLTLERRKKCDQCG